MFKDLVLGACVAAMVISCAWVRNYLAAQRRHLRHIEGRDRFNRAVQNMEKLGFIESNACYGDYNDITDISLRFKSDKGIWVYIQQQGDKVRATLNYHDRNMQIDTSIDFNAFSRESSMDALQEALERRN